MVSISFIMDLYDGFRVKLTEKLQKQEAMRLTCRGQAVRLKAYTCNLNDTQHEEEFYV